jgi:hypothetical protein
MSRQVANAVRLFCIDAVAGEETIREFQAERLAVTKAADSTAQAVQDSIQEIDGQLGRLMDGYLAEIIAIDEYRLEKAKLVETKRRRQDELAQLAKTKESWFEPAIRFVKAAIEATNLAESENDIAKRDFLKKNGSNLILKDKELSLEARGAWKTVVNPGRLAHHEIAARDARAAFGGRSDQNLKMRRGGDSNSRYPCGQTGFRNRRVQPLRHLSRACWDISRLNRGGQNRSLGVGR